MHIIYHKDFSKSYMKLPRRIKLKVDKAIGLFSKDPFDEKLKNHALKGFMMGERAISVSGDIRIIFKEYEKYTVVLLVDVGSHAHVYGM